MGVREEGFGALYRGVSLTALRQGSNQAVNFTAYSYFKEWLKVWQPQYEGKNLPSWQTTMIGLVSGAMGPLSNAPIDTIKTRLQRAPAEFGTSAWTRITRIAADMFKQEGFHAFYKGITPRIMRVAPGQAVTFTDYEYLKDKLERATSLLPEASTRSRGGTGCSQSQCWSLLRRCVVRDVLTCICVCSPSEGRRRGDGVKACPCRRAGGVDGWDSEKGKAGGGILCMQCCDTSTSFVSSR